MITAEHAQLMARYNTWQNQSLCEAASRLTDAVRKAGRGAYFGSIHGTLSHVIYGDMAWMFRFTGEARYRPTVTTIADSATAFGEWADLVGARRQLDADIERWAGSLTTEGLAGSLTYSSMAFGRDYTRPLWMLVAHLFNHQTHHRGQVHCLLTQAGVTPGDTDLPLIWPES
jgi:uncharacterized damage-inducible protein DinB